MGSMFRRCSNLESVDLSNFDTSKVTNMRSMFDGCSSLQSLDLSSFDTSKVIFMMKMFNSCSSLQSLDLSNFDTIKLPYIYEIFYGCINLMTIYCNNDWFKDGYTFDNRTSLMFENCNSLVGAVAYDSSKTSIDMANPDTGYFTRK